ncbi:MAG: hypothetical protein IPH16_13365 [Haliscomenobacter sp.]|nr:hypothetical protein [Haliscomenobacter sp.]
MDYFFAFLPVFLAGQTPPLTAITLSSKSGLRVQSFHTSQQALQTNQLLPLFSLVVNGKTVQSTSAARSKTNGDSLVASLAGLEVNVTPTLPYQAGCRYTVLLKNASSKDTLTLENFIPLGESPDKVYLTGLGKHGLSRTHLFRPGLAPVNVIVPDNAWELGYAGIELPGTNICALSRRVRWDGNARRRRFETILFPGGTVTYHIWIDTYAGPWQEGLRCMFQERYLYDLEGGAFNEALYQRPDLKWIRHAYAMHLIMGWDRDFYDPEAQSYQLESFLQRLKPLLGGTDVVGIWPNWPMLGLDQRNQWDLMRAPGRRGKSARTS